MPNLKFMLLNLPNPPDGSVYRGYAGGFGTIGKVPDDVLFPIYLLYGISAVKKSGCEYHVLDAQAMKYTPAQVIDDIKKSAPDILISWISLPSMYADLKLLSEIKKINSNTIIVCLGTVCNVMPEEVLSSGVDFAVAGQYPHYNLISNLVSLGSAQDFERIPGARYKVGNDIVYSSLEPCKEDINQLALDAYNDFSLHRYTGGIKDISGSLVECIPLLTGVGCPYSCMYCPYPIGYGKKIIQKSVDNIISEIFFLKNNFGLSGFLFRDQVFTSNEERIIQLCDEIIKNNLDIKWVVEARADQVTQELILKMKEAGCFRIHYGVETGDPEMLKKIGKPGLDMIKLKQAFKMAKDAGIFTLAHMIIGLPGENRNTLKGSIDLLCELDTNEINLNIATPYPGTKLFEMAEKKGWILTNDWSKYTSFDAVMKTDELDIDQLINAKKKIRDKFYKCKLLHDNAFRKLYVKIFLKKIYRRIAKSIC